MNVLYFKDAYDDKRIIKTDIQEDKIEKAIVSYVHKLNPSYKIYYIRSWVDDNGDTIYDVGSHTEFFILRKI